MIIQKHYAFDFPLSFIISSVAKKVESKSLRRRKQVIVPSSCLGQGDIETGVNSFLYLLAILYLIGSGGKGSRKNVKSKEELQLEII